MATELKQSLYETPNEKKLLELTSGEKVYPKPPNYHNTQHRRQNYIQNKQQNKTIDSNILTPEKLQSNYPKNGVSKYYRRKDKTEIELLGIFQMPDEKLLDSRFNFRQKNFSRNLNTYDITGSIPSIYKSDAVKNIEKNQTYQKIVKHLEETKQIPGYKPQHNPTGQEVDDNKKTTNINTNDTNAVETTVLNEVPNSLPENSNQVNEQQQFNSSIQKPYFPKLKTQQNEDDLEKYNQESENPHFLLNNYRFYALKDDSKMKQMGELILKNNLNNFYKGYTPTLETRQQYPMLQKMLNNQRANSSYKKQNVLPKQQNGNTSNNTYDKNMGQFYDANEDNKQEKRQIRSVTKPDYSANLAMQQSIPTLDENLQKQEQIKKSLLSYQKKYNAQNIANMINPTFNIVTGETVPTWKRVINKKFNQNNSMIEMDNQATTTNEQRGQTIQCIKSQQQQLDEAKLQMAMLKHDNNYQGERLQLTERGSKLPKYLEYNGVPQWNYQKDYCKF